MDKNVFKSFAIILMILFVLCPKIDAVIPQVKIEKIVRDEKVKFHSRVLDEDRTILIHLPKDYALTEKKYPVLYVLDAEFFFQQAISAAEFLSELKYINVQPIPQMIVVGIVNIDRNRDYTPTHAPKQPRGMRFPTSGKADRFLEFLNTELFPFIDTQYRTEPFRILSGWSLGGLLTVYTYFKHNHLFSAYLAISPSLWWDGDLYVKKTDTLLSQEQLSAKPLVVTLGAREGADMGRSVKNGFVPEMSKKSLKEKITFTFIEIPEEGHSYVPYKAYYQGLLALFADWMMPNEIMDDGTEGIYSFYEKQSQKYGFEIDIPESAYFRLASKYFNEGNKTKAFEIAKEYANKFPESSYAHYYLGMRAKAVGELSLAKKSFLKAIEIEESSLEPYSERIVWSNYFLQEIEKEIKSLKRAY
jgi:predicted alpha/beta superfamily hydrolase